MSITTKEYRQSKQAIYISYALYRWLFAYITIGLIVLYDWLNFKHTILTFEEKFIVYVTGAVFTTSKEIPYEDIMKVSVDQSLFGRKYDYGTVTIRMKEQQDVIRFRNVRSPNLLRQAAQTKFIQSTKHKLL